MRRIEITLDALQIIGGLVHLDDEQPVERQVEPRKCRKRRLKLARMGAVILPPVPAFYIKPRTLDEVIDHTISRMLDQFRIEVPGAHRWAGEMGVGQRDES